MPNVDLTKLPNWQSLSDGTHSIRLVARGGGYLDSDKSDSVNVTKSTDNSETWIFNETLKSLNNKSIEVNLEFRSNGYKFQKIAIGKDPTKYYGLIYYQLDSDGIWQPCFAQQSDWTADKFRKVKFTEPVTDSNLLAFLQLNAVKQ